MPGLVDRTHLLDTCLDSLKEKRSVSVHVRWPDLENDAYTAMERQFLKSQEEYCRN